ncbi:MAG: pitrilysin family protein [bacterium]|nr:pitrilysin family protein [bacterium]
MKNPVFIVRLSLLLTILIIFGSAAPAWAEIVDLSGNFSLENGLDVRLMPDTSTSMVAVMALVRTGYAVEGAGRSGFSHLLEHLVFAGTQKRSKSRIQREVEGLGGYVNGFTRDDYTAYLIVGHRDHLGQLLDVLSDMLFNSTIPEKAVDEAKAVVLEEILRSRSRPDTRDEELFTSLLYGGSPYARTGLGSETTVSAATREEIESFYKKNYRPDNMILLFRGGFEPDRVHEALEKTFGPAPMGADRIAVTKPEPILARRVYRADSSTPGVKVRIGFAGPHPRHTDAQAMELLAGVLGGGEGILDRALKSAGFMPRSSSATLAINDGFSRFIISVSLPAGADPAAVRRVLLDAIPAALTTERFPDLVDRTREAMVSAEIMEREKLHYFLMGKAPWIVSGSPGQGLSPARWDHLTAEDLAEAARAYLVEKPSVALITSPGPADAGGVAAGAVRAEAMLDNGLHVIAEQRPGSDVFALHLMTRHRGALEPKGREGIADFLHRLLAMGTDTRTREEIQAALRSMGVSLSTAGNPMVPFGDFYTSRLFSYIRLECVTEKASDAVALLADMVQNPALTDADIEEVRGQMQDFISYRSAKPDTVASGMLAERLYGGVLGPDVYGSAGSISAITGGELRDFHGRYLAGRNLIVSVVSPMAPEESISLVEKNLRRLPAGEKARIATVPLTVKPFVAEADLGRPQGALAAGAVTGEAPPADDIPALVIASGLLNVRLAEELREKEGLAYSLGASLGDVDGRVVFTFSMGTAPEKIERAREALREQLEAARKSPVNREEMEREINGLVGRLQMRMLSSINRAYYLGVATRERLSHTFGEKYRQQLLALTPEDIERVLDRYLPGDALIEAVVR